MDEGSRFGKGKTQVDPGHVEVHSDKIDKAMSERQPALGKRGSDQSSSTSLFCGCFPSSFATGILSTHFSQEEQQ